MKKIIICSVLCMILSSCSSQNDSDKENGKILPTADVIEANDASLQDNSSKQSDVIEVNEENSQDNSSTQSDVIEVDDTQLQDNGCMQSDITIIDDIVNWDHPVKDVLEDKNIPISKLELTENKTYPTFYVKLPTEIIHKEAIGSLIEPIAQANGFWNYSLVDESNNIKIEVLIDKENRKVKSYILNGEKIDFIETDNMQTKYNRYLDFLNTDGEVVGYIKEDINLDGNEEIVISVGVGYGSEKIYVLRETEDELHELGLIEGGGYGVYDAHLVSMKGAEHKYINAFVTNGANLSGFALYRIVEDGIEMVGYSASPTGVGNDRLTSSGDNNIYDGYTQHRHSYGVMYFNVLRYYKWNGESFDYISSDVHIPEYPEGEGAVIRQFLKLNMLWEKDRESKNVQTRLSEINLSEKSVNFQKINQLDDIYKWQTEIQLDAKEFDIQRSDNSSVVTVPVQNKSIVFVMTKIDGKYCITDIEGEFAY
ncbi:hypothetical protein RBH29_11685 [Herbivorax sp. ANBcel31]|uniref:hypothetical protein n=1 Tax=Herbivorax sp. ANBcel31 TaxID=3069754 RepID=UPI0027B6987A|nr:hypothetical protein [Herbivorax sp. ANBcel31]MDQ2087086.1 hypothetical protein [Herbivorax sp. ANBcel31]